MIAAVILRARWAWRCHGTTVPADGPRLTYEQARALYAISRGLRRHGPRTTYTAERSRT